MGSTRPKRKRSPSRKSVTAKLREQVACLKREVRFLESEVGDAMRALKEALPQSKTEHVHTVSELAALAARAAYIGQTISSRATKAMRASGRMPTTPEQVADLIAAARFLRPGEVVVDGETLREMRSTLDLWLIDGKD